MLRLKLAAVLLVCQCCVLAADNASSTVSVLPRPVIEKATGGKAVLAQKGAPPTIAPLGKTQGAVSEGMNPHKWEPAESHRRAVRSSENVLPLLDIELAATVPSAEQRKPRMNVLFIAVDDLRPQLGCYGDPMIKSPCIDRLARNGLVFNRAYCQQAVCSPSRTSVMTGLRPDSTRVYDLATHFRKFLPDVVTLPEHFKKHGYHTQSLSKIYHGGLDDPQSWSVPHWVPKGSGRTYGKPETIALVNEKSKRMQAEGRQLEDRIVERDPKTGLPLKINRRALVHGPPWEDPDVADNALPDGATADHAIETLRQLKDKPFFLAVGFLKPHLPFVAPRKYYDLYPMDAIKLPANLNPPTDVPGMAMTDWGELRQYVGMPKKGPLPNETAKQLIRGYYAATSYTDAQIGRVLDELDRLGLRDKTIVVLWGDHGWQLGEHGMWCKHTNFEVATRSLLIVSAPGRKAVGARSDALVEFVDMYPTLCELCGLPLPEGLEGSSMAPLLDNPNRPWKKAAFSQYPRGGNIMGYSVRTAEWRYTEWAEQGRDPVGVELYDHRSDPDENVNLAAKPEMKQRIAELKQVLHAGHKAALPK